jgi:hypothetical protein
MSVEQRSILHAPLKKMSCGLDSLIIIARPLSLDASSFWYIGLILKHVSLLPLIFRCLEANEWRVEELLSWMPVCKQWCREIRRVVVDAQWLKALRSYGTLFVSALPFLVESITSSDWHSHSYNTRLGNIEEFYGKMRATMWDVSSQSKALEAMAKIVCHVLTHNYGDRAVCMVSAVMNTHKDCALIQKQSCRALVSIALHLDDDCNRRAQGAVIPRIVAVLRRFGGDAETANLAVRALHNMMRKSRRNRLAVLAAGTVPLVLGMMRLHTHITFFETSTSLLSRLARHCVAAVLGGDVRDLLHERMAMMPEDVSVQRCAMRTLAVFAARQRTGQGGAAERSEKIAADEA